MKQKNATMLLLAAFMTGFFSLMMQTVFSQSAGTPVVDGAINTSPLRYHIAQNPVFFPISTPLSQNEMHVLDTLSATERQFIQEGIEPPLVGVIRDLKNPIVFSLNEISIPAQGESSAAGGRLTRINADTLVYTTFIQSHKANEIRSFFAEGNFPPGVKVNLFSSGDYAFNQFELCGIIDAYGFYTTTTFADYFYLQVVIPMASIQENLSFRITRVIHVDTRYLPQENAKSCYLDANCADANSFIHIDGFRRATARLYFPVGAGYGFCTGTQLNDVRSKDFQPYLLTANHCFSTQTSAAGLEARFEYWSTSCNSGVVNPDNIIVNGSNLIATNSQSDFTMVLLNQHGGSYYMGWDPNSVANNTVMHSVHHPGGTLMKYQKMFNKTTPDYNCTGFSTANFYHTKTTLGQESPGSSGGGVVDPDGRIRGQLYGSCHASTWDGCSYDTYNNLWGRFDVSYANNNLQYWLSTTTGGAGVAMSVSPSTSLGFGSRDIGSNTNLLVTVTNTGTVPNYLNLEAGNITITGTNANQFSIIGATALYLAPGASGTFTIRFTPTSSGYKTATLNIPHNADNIASPKTVALTGTGNPCSEIISMGAGGLANTKTFSKSGDGAWTTTACGFSCPGSEQVYSFVAPVTGIYSIQVTSTNSTYVDYFWSTGSCASTGWTCIDDISSVGTWGAMSWTAGTTYYILLDDENATLSTHSFYVFLNPCLNIISLNGGGSANTMTFSKSGEGGWNTLTCGFTCYGAEQIYSFVAPVTGVYSIQVTSTNSTYVDYFWSTGSCASTGWTCIDDISSTGPWGAMSWTAGTTYYILLDDENTLLSTHSFYVFLNPCSNITAIGGTGVSYPQTFTDGGNGAWHTSSFSPCGYYCYGIEHIYSFVPPYTGNYKIQVTAAGSWVDYMWKSGACSSSDWQCIDDVYNTGSYGSMAMTAGTTYYILLDDEDVTAGSHAFYVDFTETPGTWKGTVSSDWNTPGNWSASVRPDATLNVTIPSGTPNQPYVQSAVANCASLTINAGATLTVGGYALNVANNLTISGTLGMNNASGSITASGNVYWESGSTANFIVQAPFNVYGFWEFRSGANANLANGTVLFLGSTDTYVQNYSNSCSFYNIGSYKSGGAEVGISYFSTQQLTINGFIYVHPGAEFGIYSVYDIVLKGNVNSNNVFICNYGKVVLDGTSQELKMNAGNYFNNLTFSQSGIVNINNSLSSILDVNGNVVIESGIFNIQDRTMHVGGSWTNTAGTAGFAEGTSRVVFNGSGYQEISSSETFNIIEANMGTALRINNAAYTVTCAQYDWTTGGIEAVAGTFTALDLADDGLDGSYTANTGGTINLYQDLTQYIDLRGNLSITTGGAINVYGGNGYSYWPYIYSASVTMSGGVLDFKDNGIMVIENSLTLTDNISGGTIRMAKGFMGNRADFTPAAGTFEFYGPGDYSVSQYNDCTLPNVTINKSVKGDEGTANVGALYDKRSGALLSDGGKSNTILLASNFVVTGNLSINAGSFDLSSYTCNVTNETNIYGTLNMTNPLNDLTSYWINWRSGSNDNVTAGTFHSHTWRFYDGTNARIGTGNTAYTKDLYYPEDADAEFGNLVALPLSKLLSGGAKIYYPCNVAGNFTLQNGASWFMWVDLIVGGNSVIENGGSIYFYYGADYYTTGSFDLSGTITTESGSIITTHGALAFPSTGILNLGSGGSFICDYNAASGFSTINGTLNMAGTSVFEISGQNVSIGPAFINLITGGTLRFGRTLGAPYSSNFQLNAGTVEFITGNTGHYMQVVNGNYLNNMTLNKPGGTLQVYDDLILKGSLNINDGILNSNNKTIGIGGDWLNNVGVSAFLESAGRVIFNGTGTQFCSTENFNILEVNNMLYNVSSSTINCQVYDWTSGGLWISPGNFSAADLADNGLYGILAIWDGTMDLHQDAGNYIDLNADVYVGFGGTLNVYGGSMTSYWPYYSSASLTVMPTGVLDFKDVGIYVYNHPYNTFTENINGGTIRTSGSFMVDNLGFTPTGGTVELYGGVSALVYNIPGTNFHDLLCNKTGGGAKTSPDVLRDGTVIKSGKSNSVGAGSNLQINNTLNVTAGTFSLNGYEVSVNNGAAINSGGIMDVGPNSDLLLGSGSVLTVNNLGSLSVLGYTGNEARISGISGNYELNVASGGTLAAQYGIFEYMGSNGINIQPGGIIDPFYPFNYCTFQNGAAGGRLLTINNNQDFNVTEAVFPTNTWGGLYNVGKTINAGTVNFIDATGGFAGELYENDPYGRINWGGLTKSLSLNVFVEGLYNAAAGMMNKAFDDVGEHFPGPQADEITVELHHSTAPFAVAHSISGLPLYTNGSVTATVPGTLAGSYYLAVQHRNSIETWSAAPVSFAGGSIAYDFTDNAAKAYGSNMKEISGVFVIYGGDVNQDDVIDGLDMIPVDNLAAAFGGGYIPEDINGDGSIDALDMIILDNNAAAFISAVFP